VQVELEWYELEAAAFTAVRRQVEWLKQGKRDRGRTGRQDGLYNQNWTESVIGVCGELAFAKARGLYFDHSVNTFKAPDVGGAQVRTRTKAEYELIVSPDAKDDEWYVLVVPVQLPRRFRVVGTIRARDAKRDEWLQTYGGGPPAYFVPHAALRPLPALARG
jgi:hypothetical protein